MLETVLQPAVNNQNELITLDVAGDPGIIRRGTRLILEQQPDFKVLPETDKENDGNYKDPKPAIVVVAGSGPDCLRTVRKVVRKSSTGNTPKTKVVVLSDSGDDALGAFNEGAMAFVLTKSDPEDLINAVREVAKNDYYVSPGLSQQLIRRFATVDLVGSLTRREREIFTMRAESYTSAQIAERLKISRRTVELHVFHIRKRLGLPGNVKLVTYAREKGLVTNPD